MLWTAKRSKGIFLPAAQFAELMQVVLKTNSDHRLVIAVVERRLD
jgi:hypothetical protein